MSTELARVEFTSDQVSLIKRVICVGATDDELALFLQQCNRTGLDPFAKQIYGIKRKGKLSIQIGIDGFRLIAQRTGQLDGQEGPFWCGEDGVWRDVWTAKTPPVAAKVIVYRKGCARGFMGVARFTEYAQYYDGQLMDMWARMPANQIAKCSEALALRKGFPQELSGLYAPEEMDQAGPTEVETEKPRDMVKQLPAKPTGPDPLEVALATGRAAIARAASVEQLGGAWAAMSRQVQAELEGEKNARKAALTPAPAAKEGVQSVDFSTTTGGVASPPADDGIPKAGAAIVSAILPLMHALYLSWPEIRDGDEGKGKEIADAAALPKMPAGAKVIDLSAPEALRLKGVLEPRVAAKKAAAAKRAEGAARKAREEDPVPA